MLLAHGACLSFELKHACKPNRRILASGVDFLIAVQAICLGQDDPFFHAQKDRYLMGFPTPSLFAPSEHLIGGCRINAMFAGERLNGLSLMFQPGLGLCGSTDSGHSSKPFKFVQ